MADSPQNKFQWKWVWISLSVYIIFYFLPLSLVPGGLLSGRTVTRDSITFIGIWSIGGMLIISAITGLFSKGVTIKEPAVAAVGLMFLWFIATQLRFIRTIRMTTEISVELIVTLFAVGLLALAGAWWGEQLQKASRKNKQV